MLAEPLQASCDFLAAIAKWTCRESADGRCDWYHGTWQYLRLLDLTSNPGWHSDYFIDTLRGELHGREEVNALVCGCADYSMYAHVVAACEGSATVSALDWCATPLISTEWYADRIGAPRPRVIVADATTFVEPESYDLIVSDSFLPRFSDAQVRQLLGSWRACLREGGRAVTTVRIHGREGSAGRAPAARSQASLWREAAERSRSWWASVSTLSPEELASRVESFAVRQERNAIYSPERVAELFADAGFKKAEVQTAMVNKKLFARVVAWLSGLTRSMFIRSTGESDDSDRGQ